MLRSLGLLVDGPARWGSQAASRSPGVFIVELPGGAESAAIDIVAVRRWIERVPSLRLDGEVPTPQDLAKRLHEFWLPGEPVLYVARSAKALNGRVASMYATLLGDARPHSGGHWLKTLSVLQRPAHLVGRDRRARGIRGRPARRGGGAKRRQAAVRKPVGDRRISESHGIDEQPAGRVTGRQEARPSHRPSRDGRPRRQPARRPRRARQMPTDQSPNQTTCRRRASTG